MVKYILLFLSLCFILTISCKAQDEDSLADKISAQIVFVKAVFKNDENKIAAEFGEGIVLKGQYLATCYHLIEPKNKEYKLFYTIIFFNKKTIGGEVSYDSIFATREFKAEKGQYDFSKHVHNLNDWSTDYVVLKLKKKYKEIKYSFASSYPPFWELVFALGHNDINGIITEVYSKARFITRAQFTPYNGEFCVILTRALDGFSGTPIFNSKMEILGIVDFMYREVPTVMIDDLYNNGFITKSLHDNIPKHYELGEKLQFALDFDFLKRKYLAGYF